MVDGGRGRGEGLSVEGSGTGVGFGLGFVAYVLGICMNGTCTR